MGLKEMPLALGLGVLALLTEVCMGVVPTQAQTATSDSNPGSGDWNTRAFHVHQWVRHFFSLLGRFLAVLAAMLLSATTITLAGAQTLSWGPTGAGGSGTWDNATVNWFNGSTAVPWTSGGTAVFGGTAGTVTVNGTVAVGGATFNTNGYTITSGTLAITGSALTITSASNGIGATIGSTISGSNLTVLGSSVTLSSLGAISYTGSTTVANGATLTFASPNLASAIQSTAFFVNGPSTLVANAQNREDIHGTITFDGVGGGTVDFTGTLNFGGVVLSGPPLTIVATGGAQDRVISSTGIGLNINLNNPGLILNTADASSSLLVSSRLWNGGSVTKTGPGTAILTFANIYFGPTILNGGVLSVSNLANGGVASNIGRSTNAAANLVFNGGTLQYTGAGVSTDRQFTLGTGGGTIDASGSGALNFTNTAAIAFSGTGPRALTLTGSNTATNTLAAVLGDSSGPSSLIKAGVGRWVMTGANSYTGDTAINGGTLQVSADNNLGAATGVLSFNGGTLATTSTFTTGRTTTLNPGGGTIDVAPGTVLTMAVRSEAGAPSPRRTPAPWC
jgi:autotransporter-associated beta strand protein